MRPEPAYAIPDVIDPNVKEDAKADVKQDVAPVDAYGIPDVQPETLYGFPDM